MTLDRITAILLGWAVIAVIIGGGWCIAVSRFKARQHAEHTRVALYPPPVPAPVTPPFSQTTPDVSWFRDMPADSLGDEAIRLVCDDIDAHFTVIDGAE